MNKVRAMTAAGGASLAAIALILTPALAAQRNSDSRPSVSMMSRSIGTFTPAVSDPRLAAALARSGATIGGEFRFTRANPSRTRDRPVLVAIRAGASTPAEAARNAATASASTPVTAITPISYNLGVSVGWRRFALSGDVAQSEGGVLPGERESARVGMSYRADRRITGRVQVAAERAQGVQRILADDEAYSLDVGGSYSIARNIDVTGGVRYRVAHDRLQPLAGDERRDSQAVYIGTAFKF